MSGHIVPDRRHFSSCAGHRNIPYPLLYPDAGKRTGPVLRKADPWDSISHGAGDRVCIRDTTEDHQQDFQKETPWQKLIISNFIHDNRNLAMRGFYYLNFL